MQKRMLGFFGTAFIALVLLFLLVPQWAIAEDGPTLSIDSIPMLHPSEQATVSVHLGNVTSGVNMLQFAVEYNHEELRLLSTVAGSIFDSAGSPVINDQVLGIVYFNWEGDTTLSQDTVLLEMIFEPATTSTINSTVSISAIQECVVANWEAEFIPIKETGIVHIEKEWAIPKTIAANFEGKIGLNYYMWLPDYVLNDPGAYALLIGENSTQKQMVTAAYPAVIDGEQVYVFSYYMVAYEIRDTIRLKLYDSDGNVISIKNRSGSKDYTDSGAEYSLYAYCDYMKDNGSTAEMRALAAAALDYCTAAQLYFDYHVTEGMSVSSAVDTVQLTQLAEYQATLDGTMPTNAELETITAQFDSDNSLRVYFRYLNDSDPYAYSYSLDGNSYVLRTGSGGHYVSVDNVPANHLGDMHLVGISDGEKTAQIRCGVLTYARLIIKNGQTEMSKELGKALYLYSIKAHDYFGDR